MAKNNYSGIEVYISKLKTGTKFECKNGHWKGEFRIEEGVPKLIVDGGTIRSISDGYILNISTDEHIPFEAYVYKSVFYAQEFKMESKKLEGLYRMVNDVLLTEKEIMEIGNKIDSIIKNLSYLKEKFKILQPENYH